MTGGIWIALIVVGGAAAAFILKPAPPPLEPVSFQTRVTYVVDGDTVGIASRDERVRLFGIDAAEDGETGAQEATEALKGLVLNRRVKVIPLEYDIFGRIVARLELKDGSDVSRIMIETGYAVEFCRYSKGYYGHCG